ncbi:MAG: transcriptional repressor [Rhodospirillales bacterium]|nr:MAG: transcriptional repressor [Rhodospirillales bacterium]
MQHQSDPPEVVAPSSASAVETPFGADHDHQRCRDHVLSEAERRCAERQVRLTPQRRRVLEVIADRHGAIGAYEIIARLGEGRSRPAPISVYRALDFLMAQGLVHRLASLNAFIACSGPDRAHGAQFLICRGCGVIGELNDASVEAAIGRAAAAAGFAVAAPLVEVTGLCRSCRTSDAPA